MVATLYKATVTLPYVTGPDDDIASNGFHFLNSDVGTTSEDDADVVAALVSDFYNTSLAGSTLMDFMSDIIDNDSARIRVYDLLDPEPRAPLLDAMPGFVATGTTALPQDVCAVFHFRRIPVSGSIRARERNHIKLGPLQLSAREETAQGAAFPSVGLQERLGNGAQAMFDALAALPFDLRWVAFSATNAGAEPWTLGDLIVGSRNVEQWKTGEKFATLRKRDTEAVPSNQWITAA
jgi:hypothetical protein